jgi:hypothetical protein
MDDASVEQTFETVGSLAQLYLGNILYAIELAALSLDEQNRHVDASFYRGIARKLAEAHGRSKQQEIEKNGHSNTA